jgi:hypothetical protein
MGREEAEKTFKEKVFKATAEKQEDFGLGDFEDFGGFSLGQLLFLLDECLNFEDNFRFSKNLFRIVDAEVGEYIA